MGVGVHPFPMDRMTDACENTIFPQLLLRTVINVCADDWTAECTIITSNVAEVTKWLSALQPTLNDFEPPK